MIRKSHLCAFLSCAASFGATSADIEWTYDTSRRVTIDPSQSASAVGIVDARARGVDTSDVAEADGRFQTRVRSNAARVNGFRPGFCVIVR